MAIISNAVINNATTFVLQPVTETPFATATSVSASSTASQSETEEFIVLSGPEDILLINTTHGVYQQSVTLTARMYPIEAVIDDKSIWGIPAIIWGVIIGFGLILIIILATLFFCCWLQPRSRKTQTPNYYNTAACVSHHSIVPKSQSRESQQQNPLAAMSISLGMCPPEYSSPPPPTSSDNHNLISAKNERSGSTHYLQYQYQPRRASKENQNFHPTYSMASQCNKSMWALNPLYSSNNGYELEDVQLASAYRTRSLPSWGKNNKQRPVSTPDDLETLYAKVNFSKKLRNRMRNNEAAIIALCRSRSQNLSTQLCPEQEAVVVYDERTAL